MMILDNNPVWSLEDCFGDLPDPRVVGRCDHRLIDIVIIAICAVLSGADSWDEVEVFGESKEAWLRHFLALPHGIPSHDTFRRVFSLLDATAFQERFMTWVESTFSVGRDQVIAIDGKSLRRSHNSATGQGPLHLVSAWATASGLVLGQRKVETNSNEIEAIPELLKQLFLKGCVVTIDAMGCQKDIVEQIVDKKANYVLAVKGNQPRLHQDLVDWFAWAHERQFRDVEHSYAETVNKRHGRIEVRRCWALSDKRAFELLEHHEGWRKLTSIALVQRERRIGEQTQTETVYFISSLPADAGQLLDCVRSHWAIENQLHWALDVTFNEDQARFRSGDGAENFAILRRMCLNLLRHHPAKLSLKRKRFKAALDDSFLLDLLTHV